MFRVACVRAFKRIGCVATKSHLRVNVEGEQADFKNCVVFNPRQAVASTTPRWTLIYLHSFSNRGTDYLDYPHYFGISGAALRVVLPTAPQLEQDCFKDWMVWRGERLQWRRIKFNAWFNYLTDRAGKCENDIDLESLLRMRARIHALIRSEVARLGGDAKRVIIGGASQGCCVALDAALTYPQELGGVVGLVGHVLGSTPLDPSKRSMPLHLFHEASDKEMNWKWVKDTVQRLIDGGFNVASRREPDPSGSGHWIQDIEGPWIRSALRRIISSSETGAC
uniref:Phospholipase/carboxylesterase/thioesterase domain-containing protein n=1 Tax=Alexandrium andersonii TaxID=327968 RepID=A0A7S2H831_9DINO|mmetsp:Transcript_68674/g.153863  ORF Transcript_68674/g.153863 Transcript_68674/m.153863 type:complete len:280 (+) Transcript_68674:1-840(+)